MINTFSLATINPLIIFFIHKSHASELRSQLGIKGIRSFCLPQYFLFKNNSYTLLFNNMIFKTNNNYNKTLNQ